MEEVDSSHQTSVAANKPIIVGIYGLPGAGKTHLLNQFRVSLERDHFEIIDGSDIIEEVMPGGLEAFRSLTPAEKLQYRERAIKRIVQICTESGRIGVVAGHYMFWEQPDPVSPTGKDIAWTEADEAAYSQIVYLKRRPETLHKHRVQDLRQRPPTPTERFAVWQDEELDSLLTMSSKAGVDLTVITTEDSLKVWKEVTDCLLCLQRWREANQLQLLRVTLDKVLSATCDMAQVKTVLVFDGDKTLSDADTGGLFWESVCPDVVNPLDSVFSGQDGPVYSYTSFRRMVGLYHSHKGIKDFDRTCEEVAAQVVVRSEFVRLLEKAAQHSSVGIVVVTCGLSLIWTKIVDKLGMSDSIGVMGNGRDVGGLIITHEAKAAIIDRLRGHYQKQVWAFGDSPLDLAMLRKADQAVVVVGNEHTRSRSMDAAMTDAIENSGLRAMQSLMPKTVKPRLDTARVPVFDLARPDVLDFVMNGSKTGPIAVASDRLRLLIPVDDVAKVLMTATRDARIQGHQLREAHRKVGHHLATTFLPQLIGLEEVSIPHVQGHDTKGHRLLDEHKTCVMPLMRGGEPMAFGVSEAFPAMRFQHVKDPKDVKPEDVADLTAVILVDSVINTGMSICGFVDWFRQLKEKLPVIVVAGVIQQDAVENVLEPLTRISDLSVIALRLSQNEYTGRGGTDTGHRLFNTTHLD